MFIEEADTEPKKIKVPREWIERAKRIGLREK